MKYDTFFAGTKIFCGTEHAVAQNTRLAAAINSATVSAALEICYSLFPRNKFNILSGGITQL